MNEAKKLIEEHGGPQNAIDALTAERQNIFSRGGKSANDSSRLDYIGLVLPQIYQFAEARAEGQETLSQVARNGIPPAPGSPRDEYQKGNTMPTTKRNGLSATDKGLMAWAKTSVGQSLSAEEHNALASLGYSESAAEIEIPLDSHDLLLGRQLYAARGVDSIVNAQSVGSDVGGGFVVPQSFLQQLEVALMTTGSLFQTSRVIRTPSGEQLSLPTSDDTGNEGELLQENTSTNEQDVNFGALKLGSYTYSSKEVRVSNQLLRDSGVDVGAVLARLLGERIGRITNKHFATGDGAAKPSGLMPSAAAGITAASSNAITADEIIQLVHSVDRAYRNQNSGFLMNDSTFREISLLKDGDGNYLLRPGLSEAASPTLRGWPVSINEALDDIASGNEPVAFGDLSKFVIRQVGRLVVRRLVERHADRNQTSFLAFASFDSGLLDAGTEPIKKLKMA